MTRGREQPLLPLPDRPRLPIPDPYASDERQRARGMKGGGVIRASGGGAGGVGAALLAAAAWGQRDWEGGGEGIWA